MIHNMGNDLKKMNLAMNTPNFDASTYIDKISISEKHESLHSKLKREIW